MATSHDLAQKLARLDGSSYGTLKQLQSSWTFDGFTLHIDKVQADPYAPASKMHLSIPLEQTPLPTRLLTDSDSQVAVADFIARDIADAIAHGPREFGFTTPGQEILLRSSVALTSKTVEVRFTFAFPAAGRRVKGRLASKLLVDDLPDLVRFSALGEQLEVNALEKHCSVYEDFLFIQSQLGELNLVGFVQDGAILPRATGTSDVPLKNARPFTSPTSLQRTFELPSGQTVTGMGISRGITLIVGGGFHGKSTLLRALERGVYAHIPGDGRELVVCDPTAITIRAEDGRAVTGANISPFISNLPGAIDTENFSTQNASGSTSQAANLVEALEIGATTLLIDEDTSATNFMIRDALMRELISSDHEPITPFVDRISALYEELGVSTILVMGGSSAFFDLADTVITLTEYVPRDVTDDARRIAAQHSSYGSEQGSKQNFEQNAHNEPQVKQLVRSRAVLGKSLTPNNARKPPRARGLEQIQMGREDLDVRYLSQLVDSSQTQTIALSLRLVAQELEHQGTTLAQACQQVVKRLEHEGLDELVGGGSRVRDDLALPRPAELMQAISRWRRLQLSAK